MNKRQSRMFALASSGLAAVVFLGLTIHSHTRFDELTNAENLTDEVVRGKDVWHKYNCVNCHTLFGEGAYYAPDLTKIAQQRGEPYIKAYMQDPSKFYDEQKHRRLMPKQDLSEAEINDLYAFLDWVSKVDNQGWPPRPIIVSGASIPGTDLSDAQQAVAATASPGSEGQEPPGARPVASGDNPIALGQAVFRATPPGCFACHSVAPGVNLAGPTLSGVGTRAEKIIAAPDYKGKAKTAAEYVRESITDPNAYLIPGPSYSANGQSFMPVHFGKDLTSEQIDQLTAYLMSLK
jgi:nitric oxide reductase subunit C